ncbi:MAG: hypothetical protein MSG64_06365 [Pyrinomonadaceae bacterium MAG19_C2-C3]|nr:hypothetical protein [Pyrinomonadaceae bacterium MAG19_C2-C3]
MANKKENQESNVNIKFIGKDEEVNGKMVAAEPFKSINHGMKAIKLPDAETQRAGFYHDDAIEIIRLFPNQYKQVVKVK